MQQQKGVVRVNCIDNLDRTNVVQARRRRRRWWVVVVALMVVAVAAAAQSVFSQYSLDRQLRTLGYLGVDEKSASMLAFESATRCRSRRRSCCRSRCRSRVH